MTLRPSSLVHRLATASFTLGLAFASYASSAQEVLPREEAMKYAFLAAMHEPATMAAPIKVDADLKRPFAGHEGDYGVLVLPETKISAAALSTLTRDPAPVGQLWLRNLTPLVQGTATADTDLQIVSLWHEGQSIRVPLCLLGARKTEAGGLELLVYSKGRTPLLTVPLKRDARAQKLPIEVTGEQNSDSGTLRLHVLGEYVAEIPVTELQN